jgi:hypothetical protein
MTGESTIRSNRLPVLAAEIRTAHTGVAAAVKASAESAIAAGHALIEAKSLVRHGEWLPFLAEAGIHERTAQRYIALAEGNLQSDTVSLLGGPTAALRFLSLRARAMDALAEAEAKAGRPEGIEPIERFIDNIAKMIAMFPEEGHAQ